MSSADLISGRDCKDVIVESDRRDVAAMLDGVIGDTGRRGGAAFVGSSSSCEEDEEDQKDRDGCEESDGGASLTLPLVNDDVAVSRW
mmetsp:Transcript_17598/g.28802  ORF Transcript_17598/g.28802 Transcript_17598/m.28802 type:complete len:87 (-) Transcript_17598:122-382(-)